MNGTEIKNNEKSSHSSLHSIKSDSNSCRPETNKRERWVALFELYPSQASIGFSAAEAKKSVWEKEAEQAGVPLKHFAETTLRQRFSQHPLPAFIDPTGHIRIIDGHHKIWALRTLMWGLEDSFQVPVNIEHDFDGVSARVYQDVMAEHYPIAGITPQERIRSMAHCFDSLKDDPFRALVGQTLRRLGIRSQGLQHYAQFTLCNALKASQLFRQRLQTTGLMCNEGKLYPGTCRSDVAIKTLSHLLTAHRPFTQLVLSLAKNEDTQDAILDKLRVFCSKTQSNHSALLGLAPRRPPLAQPKDQSIDSKTFVSTARRHTG